MEHIYMRIPVGKWSIDSFFSNLCIFIGTCLLEPNVATLLVVSNTIKQTNIYTEVNTV